MEFGNLSRWKSPKCEAQLNAGSKVAAIIIVFTVAVGGIVLAYYFVMDENKLNWFTVSSAFSDVEKASSETGGYATDPELKQAVTYLASRVKALEADNHRIGAELDELIGNDGVINRLVSHIRSLHAQNEATRRDVVDAMTGSMSENDPAFGMEGVDPTLPMEAAEVPLLSKARHTIVTPIAATPKAEEREVLSAKQKVKATAPEPDEGATN